MNDLQIEEIHRTRTAAPHVNIYSPVSGFVIARNISPRQRFDKGTELYQIADISRVWVMTDIFEKDRQFLKPGAEAVVVYQGRRLTARMTDALPQFDAQSRTLKTRFELENPGYVLQPDMFVDVELHVNMPPAITVPADALFDSGLRKTVFVDHGNGKFEARRVETGWRLGDRVEVVKGLMEGERVVGAANFLLDSESRMRAASAGVFNPETDPVCGMEVDRDRAKGSRPDGDARRPCVLLLLRRVQEEVRRRRRRSTPSRRARPRLARLEPCPTHAVGRRPCRNRRPCNRPRR